MVAYLKAGLMNLYYTFKILGRSPHALLFDSMPVPDNSRIVSFSPMPVEWRFSSLSPSGGEDSSLEWFCTFRVCLGLSSRWVVTCHAEEYLACRVLLIARPVAQSLYFDLDIVIRPSSIAIHVSAQ